MANRGTAPSWDEEQIAKFGFEEHYRFINLIHNSRSRRIEKERKELLEALVKLLHDHIQSLQS